MLSGPAQGGEEREKSSVIASPAIVMSSAIFSGASVTPSLSRKSSKLSRRRAWRAMLSRISASARRENAAKAVGDRVVAVFVEQLGEPPLAELERVELAVEIAVIGARRAGCWRRGCR